MDGTHSHTTLAYASKDLGEVVDQTVVSAIDSDPTMSNLCFSEGSKRKCSAVDWSIDLKTGSSHLLGLTHSSSSFTSICSGKEMEEDSFIDLGLRINLNTGDNRLSNPKKVSTVTLDAHKIRKPILDLQLSLSTGPAESDVTILSQGLIACQNYSESPALAPAAEIVDEGSTSSRWKTGPLVPPLQKVEISSLFDQNHVYSNPNLLSLNIPSAAEISPSAVGNASCLVNKQQQQKTGAKTCKFEGCTTGARGASGLCITHGGGRRCQRAGCQKGAEGKAVFCKAHGGGRRCHHLGCTKSAEGRTGYCIHHGGGRRCNHDGCSRAARGKSGLCIRHGGGKRCKMENCTKSAEGISGLCISHGGGRRCQYPKCTKGAQGSTMLCKAHGGGRRCMFLGCTKGAEGGTLFCKGHGGGKRCTSEGCTKSVHGGTLFCVSHGGGKRCAAPECTKSAWGCTNYCVRHGGGKRCKFDGCTKSAQGSTDFCKAHGGGKRCLWGQMGSAYGCLDAVPCDKFARGRSGLCAAHSTQVQEKSFEMVSATKELESRMSIQMKGIASENVSYPGTTDDCGATSIGLIGYGHQLISLPNILQEKIVIRKSSLDRPSLPEGRVHGGNLMSMLGQESSYHMPHSWV
ncbi:hypothetical protein Salat_0789400 [Sesamum alatum]|uniref:WRKY19-like zinc finger domain-containing protein n=1 Tax=Sesamum alatum TaxID=300844 RepID=A0AAE1YU66_9LAMI|nr:hypothetical protein Salat_0789400 [Sesamum alatum]